MILRRKTKQIFIGSVGIGSDFPISIQSMTNTDTRDIPSTIKQIINLENAGCEIVRLAVIDNEAAGALKQIKKAVKIPLIADIHFDYKLAIASIKSGVDGLRLNPGNIGSIDRISKVVKLAAERQIPIRIGVNSGSLEKEFHHLSTEEGMISSALKHIKILEDLNFDLIKLSLKSSSVTTTINAYKKVSEVIKYPLHIGITESGTLKTGVIKSSVGIGSILSNGIGDTIRVSLTADPTEEVYTGFEILKSLGLRQRGINLISCPTCGRCEIDLEKLANFIEDRYRGITVPITIAIMGCVVNGPGEASDADIGIAGGKGQAVIFKGGKILKTVSEDSMLNIFSEEINKLIESKTREDS